MIDHSILHPTFTDEDLVKHCKIAVKYNVATVCVKPHHVRKAYEIIEKSNVAVCAVIGFPHGNSTIDIKKAETLQVIADGAKEVDMVVNIGKVKLEVFLQREYLQKINMAGGLLRRVNILLSSMRK